MYTAARNKVWDHFRRQKVAILTSVQDSAAMMVADPTPTPLEAVESRELALKIVAAVEALPLAQREDIRHVHPGWALSGGDLQHHRRPGGNGQESATLRQNRA